MKKVFRLTAVFLFSGLSLGLGGLLALSLYYRNHFPVNTWINGVYCTGKSVEEINEELAVLQEAPVAVIRDADAADWQVDLREAGVKPDFREALRAYLRTHASAYWLGNLRSPVSSRLEAGRYVTDRERLLACLSGLAFVGQERGRAEGVRVLKSAEGFSLQDGNVRRLDLEKACAYVEDCLSKGQTEIDLLEGACYEDLPDTPSDEAQRELWAQICRFTERGSRIVYDMGAEKIPLTPGVIAGFLKTGADGIPLLDGEGRLLIDEGAVQEWVAALAADYDTCGTEREFASTRGDLVKVKYVTYGTELDPAAEEAYLLGALRSGEEGAQPHVPAYTRQGYARGRDDIGGTYIEIDMTEQKMYYYVDGALALETDVVTGNTGRRMGTPQGINFVYGKARNRTLRGAGYASFVKYWMPVKGGVGIHDASWRGAFGGEIYKTNGSHGCINTPEDVMAQLYEMAEVGTPVVMFY